MEQFGKMECCKMELLFWRTEMVAAEISTASKRSSECLDE